MKTLTKTLSILFVFAVIFGANTTTMKSVEKPYDMNTADLSYDQVRAAYVLTVGGGDWDSEITWDISLDGTALFSGAAGAFDIDLDDGTYIFNGFDSYGDGWNGATATLADADGAVQFSLGFDAGSEFSAEFTVPSADVFGCTDPLALNYNPDATIDDGTCEYEAPANDTCENAELLTAPAAGEGTNQGATVDCEGLLDWNATWYMFDMPFESNKVTITMAGVTEELYNAGIILMDDCACDDYLVGVYEFDEASMLTLEFSELPAGLMYWPALAENAAGLGIDFAYTLSVVEEVYGCTDPIANNFNPDATIDDGSCTYDCDGTIVFFNLVDSYGDGWNGNNILFGEDSLTVESGTEAQFMYCLADGEYTYTFDAAGEWISETSWTLVLEDGTIIGSGAGTAEPADYTFTLPVLDVAAPYGVTAVGSWDEASASGAITWAWQHDDYVPPVTYLDCDGVEFGEAELGWIADGYCDDGSFGINFLCDEWGWDCGDCVDYQDMPDPNGLCPEPFCGDGICNGDETEETCPEDCLVIDCATSFTVVGIADLDGDGVDDPCYDDGSGYFSFAWEGGCLATYIEYGTTGMDLSSYGFTDGFLFFGFDPGVTETFTVTFDNVNTATGTATNACGGDATCGDGFCNGDETFETCPEDCFAPGECAEGEVLDCVDDTECWTETWIGDGYCDGTAEAYGANLCCFDLDGGDCTAEECADGRTQESQDISLTTKKTLTNHQVASANTKTRVGSDNVFDLRKGNIQSNAQRTVTSFVVAFVYEGESYEFATDALELTITGFPGEYTQCGVVLAVDESGAMSGASEEACATTDPAPEADTGDTIEDPLFVDALPFTAFGTTVGFYDDYDAECPYTGSTSSDVVYSYTPAADGAITIDLCGEGSLYDTKVYVFENSADFEVGCNDDECANSTTSYLSYIEALPVTAGNTYYIVVDGYGGASGDYELNISGGTLPDTPPAPFNLVATTEEDDYDGDGVLDNAISWTWDHADYSEVLDCDGEEIPAWWVDQFVGDGECDPLFNCEEYAL
ncbi:MAG: hypothetical protein ISS11_05915, partial [Candidatus Marinimicrobia bacterium]|nr:hypothetical protein [Candidatus Neomarinimicrobiota bacterium]